MLKPLPLLVAQITDLHLFAAIDRQLLDLPTHDSLQAVLERLAKLQPKPDILLLTGDLSQDGSHKSYERLQDLLVPFEIPTYWLAGNHDRLPVMQQVLAHPPISSEKSFQAGGWHFLLLNSLVPGSVCGQLSQESLEWLDWQLQQESDRPTLIGLHHPPCLVHSNWLDTSTLRNPADFFAIIDRHPQVKLVVFGHIHQEFNYQRYKVRYLGSPSTCFQFKPKSVDFALDLAQPGFRLFSLFPDGTYETRIERIEECISFSTEREMVSNGY